MSTLGGTYLSLLDWAKRLDPDGTTPLIAELLNQKNSILQDMPWKESNEATGHRATIRTALPTAYFRKLYGGVPRSKSGTAQITDSIGMLEARSSVDKDLAELNGNTSAFRLSEAVSFVEAMNQTMATTVFYGNTDINPERFNGLAPRYNSLSGTIAQNVLTAGGSGSDNASIWLIAWGENTVCGLYPKGSKAGLFHEDIGLDDELDANQDPYRAYKDHWQWKCGLHVKDWRYIVRIANIDVSDLAAQTGAQETTDITTMVIFRMLDAINRLPDEMGNPVFYMNRTVKAGLDKLAMQKTSNVLAIEPGAKQFQTTFMGIPIRKCDALLSTETAVA